MELIAIAIGGFFGSVSRFFIGEVVKSIYSTFLVNITGSILLASTLYSYISEGIPGSIFLMISLGFCGAFTTFSTFSYEAFQLFKEKKYLAALVYVASSITLSIFVVSLILLPIL